MGSQGITIFNSCPLIFTGFRIIDWQLFFTSTLLQSFWIPLLLSLGQLRVWFSYLYKLIPHLFSGCFLSLIFSIFNMTCLDAQSSWVFQVSLNLKIVKFHQFWKILAIFSLFIYCSYHSLSLSGNLIRYIRHSYHIFHSIYLSLIFSIHLPFWATF